jgi:hypothetical protein
LAVIVVLHLEPLLGPFPLTQACALCRCTARELVLSDREASISALEKDGELMRRHLSELTAQLQASASKDSATAHSDRQRLEREAARLDAAVAALEGQRTDAAASLVVERGALQAARVARDAERERFVAEVSEERRRVTDERVSAWADVDKARAESLAAQSKVAELEARATISLKTVAAAREEAADVAARLHAERFAIAECAPAAWYIPSFALRDTTVSPRT